MAIDEVSSVDVDANGHAAIVISKRDTGEDDQMPRIFDPETQEELDEDSLEFGDQVLGEDGQIYEYVSQEDLEALEREAEEFAAQQGDLDDPGSGADELDSEPVLAGVGKRRGAQSLVSKRDKPPLGQAVLGMLSKALNEADRDDIISKTFNVLERRLVAAERTAAEAVQVSKRLANAAELASYAGIASELGVPADPQEFGEILQAVSGVLSKRQLDTFERVLVAAGDANLNEIGSRGTGSPSAVIDQLEAAAESAISKSGVTITKEQAFVAMLEANPEFYDAYMDEQR